MMFNPIGTNNSLFPHSQSNWRIDSFVLLLLVLELHKCSGFALQRTPFPSSSFQTKTLSKQDQNWWKRFGELQEYNRQHGDCNVPFTYYPNIQLGRWVSNQRQAYKGENLNDDRIEDLESIGFEWTRPLGNRDDDKWLGRLEELKEYQQEHGDTLVPTTLIRDSNSAYRELAMWVVEQRRQYHLLQEGKHSPLSDDRISKLNEIGFIWSSQEAAWEESFSDLVEFKATHGHTDVPSFWHNNHLYNFVRNQRNFYKKIMEGKTAHITDERIQRLEDIGFEWKSKKTYQWKNRFGDLCDFYNKNGVVPIPKAEHPVLYRWTYCQKKEYEKYTKGGKTNMDEARIKDLESIGFFEVYGK